MKWKRIRAALRRNKNSSTIFLRIFQKITKWGIIVMASLISLTGLSYYPWFDAIFGSVFAFSIHIDFDVILSIFMIVHVAIGAKFYFVRRKIKNMGVSFSLVGLMISLSIAVLIIDIPPGVGGPEIKIEATPYSFDPNEVVSLRPDLFQAGSFSVFDILVHLNSTGKISLISHFNDSMDTYVIDSINGKTGYWWYYIYYSGGHLEKNMVRMDHYPWKLRAQVFLYLETESYIDTVFSHFSEEVSRYNDNNNSIIIPSVSIVGQSFSLYFINLTVVPYNLRSDTFQEGVVTAMDVIFTLGNLGNITYELRYVVRMGTSSYVHSYFVQKINNDEASGRCGWLYDVSNSFIFLSADERILTSPRSVNFYWGCL